jgi:DNA-binding NarL/FixJ family response regulator
MTARITKTKVYIIDDHPVFRHGLKQMIQADPAFVVVGEAGDDITALAEIPMVKPDIVIVDVRLPRHGGLELVRTLRSVQPRTACIMLTMHAEESTFNAAMDAGAFGYILKEDALELVLLGLRAVAAGTLYLSPKIAGWVLRRQQRVSALKETKTGFAALTATERRILQLVSENKTNKEIASQLFISHRTVETHRSKICEKLDLQGAHKLLQFAIEHRSELQS